MCVCVCHPPSFWNASSADIKILQVREGLGLAHRSLAVMLNFPLMLSYRLWVFFKGRLMCLKFTVIIRIFIFARL